MNEKTKQIVEEAKAKNAASKTTVEDAPAPVVKEEAPVADELPESVRAEHEAGRTALKRHADAAKAARKAGGIEE